MKKIVMFVLLGIFAVLFAGEANNVEAKGNKYYLINFDRYGKIFLPACFKDPRRCKPAVDQYKDKEGSAVFIGKDNKWFSIMVDRIEILQLSNPDDMEFYNSLRKDFQAAYDYVEE